MVYGAGRRPISVLYKTCSSRVVPGIVLSIDFSGIEEKPMHGLLPPPGHSASAPLLGLAGWLGMSVRRQANERTGRLQKGVATASSSPQGWDGEWPRDVRLAVFGCAAVPYLERRRDRARL
jgi:hypothetical protein